MIMLTKTHPTPEVEDAEVSIHGWILYRADRESRSHGGCAIYVRADLTSQLAMVHSNTYCDTIAVSIKTLDTLVVVNYRPPNTPYKKFAEALRVTRETINTTMKEESKVRNIFQVGDFNFPCISWPTTARRDKQNLRRKSKQSFCLSLLTTTPSPMNLRFVGSCKLKMQMKQIWTRMITNSWSNLLVR